MILSTKELRSNVPAEAHSGMMSMGIGPTCSENSDMMMKSASKDAFFLPGVLVSLPAPAGISL